jgi:hypothetical protein
VGTERLDGVVPTTAVSATPDVRSTVENVYDALRPGAPFALYEVRPVPSGVARALDPPVRSFYRLFGNWNAEEDVLRELRSTFDGTAVVRASPRGTNHVTVSGTGPPRDRSY